MYVEGDGKKGERERTRAAEDEETKNSGIQVDGGSYCRTTNNKQIKKREQSHGPRDRIQRILVHTCIYLL